MNHNLTARPRVIGWDYWNTLGLIRSYPVEPLLDVGKKALSLPLDTDAHLRDQFIRYCNTVNIRDKDRFLQEAARQFGTTVSAAAMEELTKIIDVEQDACALYGDVKVTLKSFAAAGIPQGIISNMWSFPTEHIFGKQEKPEDTPECDCTEEATELRKLLPSMDLGKYFDHVVLSCEAGYAKPEPEIFLEFCRRFGIAPHECLYVGDSIPSDVEGALRVGMRAALIDRVRAVDPKKREELEAKGVIYVTNLTQLLTVLGIDQVRS